MTKEITKRILTSLFLITLLGLVFFYSFILIISLIMISLISWIEFYGLISKIFNKNTFRINFLKLSIKALSLVYLTIFSLLDALLRTKTETTSVYFLASKQILFADLERCLLLVTFITCLIACVIIFVLGDQIYVYFFDGFHEKFRLHFYSILLTLSLSFFATCLPKQFLKILKLFLKFL